MNIKRTQIAIAVGALLVAPLVMADSDYHHDYDHHYYHDHDHEHATDPAPAQATVNGPQLSQQNHLGTEYYSNHSAGVGGSQFANAKGNVGENAASGSANEQDNMASISDTSFVFGADATLSSSQISRSNGASTYSVHNTSTVGSPSGTGAFQGASGNINVNVASGSLNQQENDAAISQAGGDAATSSANGTENSRLNTFSAVYAVNNVTMQGNAFVGASGNIGASLASGIGNVQQNELALASTGATNPGSPSATATGNQTSYDNTITNYSNSDSVSMGGNAFNGASGNIGVNAASGVSNLQLNSLAISRTGTP